MFLVMTANEEFWPTDQNVLFLGEWCKLHSRTETWQSIDHDTFRFVWENRKDHEKAYYYCVDLMDQILPNITEELNRYHSIEKSTEYYRQILGRWLFRFVCQLYDKYVTLRAVLDESRLELNTVLLSESQRYYATDYRDFLVNVTQSDIYNLQIYSDILRMISKKDFSEINADQPLVQSKSIKFEKKGIYQRLSTPIKYIFNLINDYNFTPDKSVTIAQPNFIYNKLLNLVYLGTSGKGRYRFDDFIYTLDIRYIIDTKRRQKKCFQHFSDAFEAVLHGLLFKYIPVLYLEGFHQFRNAVQNLPIKRTKIFFTAAADESSDIYRFYLAEHRNKIISIVHQHGGSNGTHQMVLEETDQSTVDFYWTYGWTDKPKQIAMCCYNAHHKRRKSGNYILYGGTSQPRYLYTFGSCFVGLEVQKVFNERECLLQSIITDMPIYMRLFDPDIVDMGWNEKKQVENMKTELNIRFDDWSIKFNKRLSMANLYITDHLGTTLLDALLSNVPTIVFCDFRIIRFRRSARDLHKALVEAKILHPTAKAASYHFNAIINDVDGWWSSLAVQSARKMFIDRFVRTDSDWRKKWLNTFNFNIQNAN